MSGATQNALVLAPHPDDEALGCGGTMRRIASEGGGVDVLFMTRGERGVDAGLPASRQVELDVAARRTREAEEACRLLGVRKFRFLPGNDGRLAAQPELAEEICRQLATEDYRSVFCPWPGDAHCDHAATYRLLHQALAHCEREISVWLYEVWTPQTPNIVLPIDGAIEAKIAAVSAYHSQTALIDYAGAFRALARYRSLFCPSSSYAEAFYTCDRSSLLQDADLPWLQPKGVVADTVQESWRSCD